jgi:hypothetical protein
MTINSRKQKLSDLSKKEIKLNKIAQEAISSVPLEEGTSDEGQEFAHQIFQQLLSKLTIDDLE